MSSDTTTRAAVPTIESDILIAGEHRITVPLKWGSRQLSALNCTVSDGPMREITDLGSQRMHVLIDYHNPAPDYYSICQNVMTVMEEALIKLEGSNGIELAPGGTEYPFRFRGLSVLVPACIIVTKAGVGTVAYNTPEHFHTWCESSRHPQDRTPYQKTDYDDQTVAALNTITIIMLAERQLKAMELGHMKSKDPIEVQI